MKLSAAYLLQWQRLVTRRHWLIVFLCLGVSRAAQSQTAPAWHSVEMLPTPRAYFASAVLGGRIFVAGGEAPQGNGQTFPDGIDVYDPSTGHWQTVGHLTQGREYLRAAVDQRQNRILFTGGGQPGGSEFSEVDVGSSAGVISMGALIVPRYLHSSAVAAGRVIVSGGWGDRGMGHELLDDSEILEADGIAWKAAGTMPAGPRAGHTMTTLADGTHVLVVGGCASDHAMTEVDLFDGTKESWLSKSPVKIARCRHTAALLPDGRVMVAGSIILSKVEPSVELFDPSTKTWNDAASMGSARFDHGMVVLPDGNVLVAGGSDNAVDGEIGALTSVEIYDASKDSWRPAPPMQDARRWPGLVVLADGVYALGGSNASGQLQTVERLTWADLMIDAAALADGAAGDAGAMDSTVPDGPAGNGDTMDASSVTDGHPTHLGKQSSGCSCEVDGRDQEWPGLVGFLGIFVLRTRRRPKPTAATH